MTSWIPDASSSFTRLLHCRMNSWHRGHPSERKKTTIETELFLSKSSMTIGLSSRLTTELLRMAWRGLAALATSDGFPEYIVDAQPQSLSSFKTAFICVEDGSMLFETSARDPFVDWCGENASTSCVDALSARRSIDDSLILFVMLFAGGTFCDTCCGQEDNLVLLFK